MRDDRPGPFTWLFLFWMLVIVAACYGCAWITGVLK